MNKTVSKSNKTDAKDTVSKTVQKAKSRLQNAAKTKSTSIKENKYAPNL